MKRKIVTAVLIITVCIASCLTGCNTNTQSGGTSPSEVLVLSVGDDEIYLNEVNYYGLSFLNGMGISADTDMSAYYSEDYPTLNDALKAQLLTQIRQSKILYLKAVEEGITLTEEEQSQVNDLVDEYIAANDADRLERLGLDEEVLTHVYTQMQMIFKLEDQIAADAEKGDEVSYGTIENLVFLTVEVDEEGNAVLDEDGNFISLSKEEKEAKKALAEEVLQRVQEGESIEDLIEEYDLSATSGTVHATTDSLKEVYQLKDGEVSEILENDFGFTIVKVVALEDTEYSEKVNAYNAQSASKEAVQAQEDAWFEAFSISDMDLEKAWDAFNFQNLL